MRLIERIKSPTPSFFKKVRNVSLLVGTVGGSILASPIALPAFLIKAAGYLAVAGGTGVAISQIVTGDESTITNTVHHGNESS